MILDSEAIFSDRQADILTADTYDSTNIVKAPANTAWGVPLNILVQVVADFVAGTSIQVRLVTATDEVFTTPVILVTTEAILLAKLVAGFKFPISFLPEGDLGFLKLEYISLGTFTTGGEITAGFLETVQTSNDTFPKSS